MQSERLTFTGHSGDLLAARLDLPEGPVRASAILAHCFTCSKDIPAARRIASKLTAHGIAVLRFDFTGLGHSGGEFANTHFSSNVQDLILAAQYLAGRGMAPQLLIGHSLGGAAAIKAAPEIESLRGVITIGAPAQHGYQEPKRRTLLSSPATFATKSALSRHGKDGRHWPLSPRKQTYVHDLTMPVNGFTP